jgi:hypothetical protein
MLVNLIFTSKDMFYWSGAPFSGVHSCLDLYLLCEWRRKKKFNNIDPRMPKGSDKSWVEKLYDKCKKWEHFSKPRLSQTGELFSYIVVRI